MKKIKFMMLAAVALFTAISCEKTEVEEVEESYTLTGDKYFGTLSVMGMDQEDIVFYAEEESSYVNILMPDVSFMSGLMPNLDMALLAIAKTSSNPNTYYAATSQMVGIYDRLPLINDVIQSISQVNVVISDNHSIYVSFICSISTDTLGDMDVTVEYTGIEDGYTLEEPEQEEPEFTLDNAEGFYITTSSGDLLLSDASVTYYKGNNAIVVDGFSFSAYLSTTTLPIIGVDESEENGMTTLTANDLTVDYTFMTKETSSLISELTCEIIDTQAQMIFSIYASMGGSGEESEYPCTFNGTITISEESYIVEEPEQEEAEFTLDHPEGFYITTSSGDVLLSSASVTYYQGNNAIVIDGFSFSAYLSTTTLPIIGVEESEENGLTTLTANDLVTEYTFMAMDTSGTISDLKCEIIGNAAQMEFSITASMGGSGEATAYPCTFNGAITISEESYIVEKVEEETTPEFTLDFAEGFYITTSSGEVLLESASVTYYQGDNAIVIDGFSFSAYLSTTTLPIIGVDESEENGLTTLTADGLVANYTFMTIETSGTISNLKCEIIDGSAQMEFSITASMGGSGEATAYPCTFNGAITIDEGNYSTENEEKEEE